MPITIKGIRLETIVIKRSNESGVSDIDGSTYSLVSSTDHVLATQSVGGYGGMALKPSPETRKALEAFMISYKKDVVSVLGLDFDS